MFTLTKVRTTRELGGTDYLNELAADVREWPDDERDRLSRALDSISRSKQQA